MPSRDILNQPLFKCIFIYLGHNLLFFLNKKRICMCDCSYNPCIKKYFVVLVLKAATQ